MCEARVLGPLTGSVLRHRLRRALDQSYLDGSSPDLIESRDRRDQAVIERLDFRSRRRVADVPDHVPGRDSA